MKPKTIITAALLLFVAASIAYLFVKESGGKTAQVPAQQEPSPAAASTQNAAAAGKVVAYYFHGNVRCTTCRTIEAYAKEAIESGFAEARRDGRLEWRIVNVDTPGNDHYVQEFELSTRSIVLERTSGGRRREWKNLDRIWELVRGEKAQFLKYVQDEAAAYLKAANQ